VGFFCTFAFTPRRVISWSFLERFLPKASLLFFFSLRLHFLVLVFGFFRISTRLRFLFGGLLDHTWRVLSSFRKALLASRRLALFSCFFFFSGFICDSPLRQASGGLVAVVGPPPALNFFCFFSLNSWACVLIWIIWLWRVLSGQRHDVRLFLCTLCGPSLEVN